MNKSTIQEINKFSELCKPIIEHLKENGNPYIEIHISLDKIKVVSVECGIPTTKGD